MTDTIEEIRKRHKQTECDSGHTSLWSVHEDRATLLDKVDELEKANDWLMDFKSMMVAAVLEADLNHRVSILSESIRNFANLCGLEFPPYTKEKRPAVDL